MHTACVPIAACQSSYSTDLSFIDIPLRRKHLLTETSNCSNAHTQHLILVTADCLRCALSKNRIYPFDTITNVKLDQRAVILLEFALTMTTDNVIIHMKYRFSKNRIWWTNIAY